MPLASRLAALLLVVVALPFGCGPRSLDLAVQPDGTCSFNIPAGGAVQYQIAEAATAAGPFTVASGCGGCLATSAPLADASAVSAFLHANAPVCPSLPPGSFLQIQLVAWQSADCQNNSLSCGESAPQQLPDGRQDARLTIPLSCAGGCNVNQ